MCCGKILMFLLVIYIGISLATPIQVSNQWKSQSRPSYTYRGKYGNFRQGGRNSGQNKAIRFEDEIETSRSSSFGGRGGASRPSSFGQTRSNIPSSFSSQRESSRPSSYGGQSESSRPSSFGQTRLSRPSSFGHGGFSTMGTFGGHGGFRTPITFGGQIGSIRQGSFGQSGSSSLKSFGGQSQGAHVHGVGHGGHEGIDGRHVHVDMHGDHLDVLVHGPHGESRLTIVPLYHR